MACSNCKKKKKVIKKLPDPIVEEGIPTTQQLLILEDYFNSKHRENYKEANEIFKLIFKRDITECSTCVDRDARAFRNFMRNIKK